MRTSLAVQPHLYIGDTTGRPLDYGMVYFGQVDKDPEFYPIDIFYDEALTIAASQPVRTKGGFLNAAGDMVEIYASEIEYSVKVLDAQGVPVFYKERMSLSSTDSAVGIKLPLLGAVLRNQAAKNAEIISVKDFGAVGDGVTDDTTALQAALDCMQGEPLVLNLSSDTYYVKSALFVRYDNIEVQGKGATLVLAGDGMAAGGLAITVNANNHKWVNTKFKTLKRIVAIRVLPSAAAIENFFFDSCIFENVFYAVRAGLTNGATGVESDVRVKNITISNCTSTACVGANASHFICSDTDNITYYGNKTFGGQNASAMGGHSCTDLKIINNYESGMVDILAGADAGIQIENSKNAIISGNITSHDIWADDSSNVVVTGNKCRKLRVTVSELGGQFDGILFSGNKCSSITVASYSGSVPEGTRVSAIFNNNTLAANIKASGSDIVRAIAIEGAIGKRIELKNNTIIADAATYSVSIARNSGLTVVAENNDFGTKPSAISGSGGAIYEKNNKNSIIKKDSGYICGRLLADVAAVSSAWTKIALTGSLLDVNNEYVDGVFTPKASGYYQFSGSVSATVGISSELGLRVNTGSGEIARCFLRKYSYAGLVSEAYSTAPIYIEAGTAVQMQYFANGTVTIASGITTCLNIVKA